MRASRNKACNLEKWCEIGLELMCYIGDIIERDITRFLLTKQIKKCTKCGIIGKHHRDKSAKDKLRAKCVACVKVSDSSHYEENRDAILAQKKEYGSRPESKQKRNARTRRRRAADPAFQTGLNLRRALNKFLKGTKNGRRTFDLVGCTSEELTEYLEKTMSPETRAALEAGEKIEIDHIIPQHAPGIDFTNDAHVRAMYHYTNFQSLDKPTNIPKRNNVPDGHDTETWVAEQHARIEACRGMKPVDTIPMNLEMLANAREFANKFRRI